MTGRVYLTPEALRQLNEIDDWITTSASADIAKRFVSAVLDHIDGISTFPLAGRARDDVRPGMRTTTFKKRTVIAYLVEATRMRAWSRSWASSTVGRTGSAPSATSMWTRTR